MKACSTVGGECKILIDSFLWFGIVFIAIGIVWLMVFRKWARNIREEIDDNKSDKVEDKETWTID